MSNTPDMKNSPCPPIPQALVMWLESFYPAKDWKPEDPRGKIDFYSGQRNIVTMLRFHYDEQNPRNIT